jgi:hypothetical protein
MGGYIALLPETSMIVVGTFFVLVVASFCYLALRP